MSDDPYMVHASDVIDTQDMEAYAATVEQDFDADQVIRHNLYIGWVMGLLRAKDVETITHAGGNRLDLLAAPYQVTVVVPYPPKDWQP